MIRQSPARSRENFVSRRRRLRGLKLALLLGSLCLLLAVRGGALAEETGVLPAGDPSNPPGQGGGTPPNQDPKLTKLAPDSVLVQVNNGVGQATIVYARKAGDAAPVLDWTDAVGTTNSIAKDKIKVQWVGQPRRVEKQEAVTLVISVETREWVEPNVTYKGTIIFFWPDGSRHTEGFILTNSVVADFTISRAKIDAVLMSGQPASANFIVSNTGKERITKFTFSSTDLEDPTTHRRADFGPAAPVTAELDPGREQTIALTLPRPSYAGTYIGTLNVIANDRVRESIPLSIITRGPTFGTYNWLPFLLFCLTLAVGYCLTIYLEQWFGLGGLERAQSLVTLDQAKNDIDKTLEELKTWEAVHVGIDVNAARLRLEDGLRELNGLLERPNRYSTDELKSSAPRFKTLSSAGNVFYDKVLIATDGWKTPETLKPLIDELDAVAFPAAADGLDNYRKELAKVLENHLGTKTALPAGAPMPFRSFLPEQVMRKQLELRIERMNMLHRVVVAIVVFITAYTSLYWKDADFGTLLDYLTVFLWALGLSATGASILTRSKSSYTQPT